MTKNQSSKEEEIDLGSLFLLVKNAFKSLFIFIGNVFNGILHFFISTLLFFKSNAKKFTIAEISGVVLGSFITYFSKKSHGSDLLLQPNFKSSKELYDNINLLQWPCTTRRECIISNYIQYFFNRNDLFKGVYNFSK